MLLLKTKAIIKRSINSFSKKMNVELSEFKSGVLEREQIRPHGSESHKIESTSTGPGMGA